MIAMVRIAPRLVLAAPLLAGLSACSSAPTSSYLAQDMTQTSSLSVSTQSARGVDPTIALAQMPEPGGSVTDIREQFYSNGLRQEIVLAGDKSPFGENKLIVAVQTQPPSTGGRTLPIWRPAEAGIKQEIVARYPQVDMQILTQPRRNALGTFGLAIGRHSSGVRCVFAWQWVEDINNVGSSSSFSRLGGLGSSAQPASIRVQMCRKDATVDDLAMAVENLTFAPRATLDRVLDPSRGVTAAGPTISTRGTSVASTGGDGTLEGALTTPLRTSRHEVADAAPVSRKKVARRSRPRREPADQASDVATAQPVIQQAAPVYQSGPRYMAPVGGMAQAGGAYASPYVNAAPPPVTKALDSSLPAAAYRGPAGQRYMNGQ